MRLGVRFAHHVSTNVSLSSVAETIMSSILLRNIEMSSPLARFNEVSPSTEEALKGIPGSDPTGPFLSGIVRESSII